MFEYEIKEVVEKQKIVKKGYCNKCGKEYPFDNEYGYIEADLETWRKSFGYGSKFDGGRLEFELCDGCTEEFLNSFKIPPKWERME